MIDTLKKWLNDIFTEPDNRTMCVMRVCGIFGFLYGIGAHAYQLFWLHAQFDFQALSTGIGIAITTLGVALGMKKDTPAGGDK